MEQFPIPIQNYTVLVRCFTFNQSKYIVDALNGFVMQQTNFPFVCLIVDDASTDGGQEVIKSFLKNECDLKKSRNYNTDSAEVTIAPHNTNHQCTMAVYFLKENHYSKRRPKSSYVEPWRGCCKYEAMCEGDDCWIAPYKLQKQVDFLEEHPDYSMCFHRAKLVYVDELRCPLLCDDIEDREYLPDELFAEWKVPTASMVFREEVIAVHNEGTERILNGDIVWVLNSAKIGKIRGMSDLMSVYRVQNTGVTYNKDIQNRRLFLYPAHFEFIKENYPFLDKKEVNYKIARAYLSRRKIQHSVSEYFTDVYKAVKYYPLIVFDKLTRWKRQRVG